MFFTPAPVGLRKMTQFESRVVTLTESGRSRWRGRRAVPGAATVSVSRVTDAGRAAEATSRLVHLQNLLDQEETSR